MSDNDEFQKYLGFQFLLCADSISSSKQIVEQNERIAT